ncbi:hypothetical protein KIPB_007187 [Kipferlia bialata]|uniref:SHSP domain-containing protein n=1 Tax=Kipferlia bialata TaxID=797122 RepID=A0A9K3GJU4_9EUKA|nr:hypothetical protein KIPB_007187 [Kipferlia bialata]|eukprot:g7187.t1
MGGAKDLGRDLSHSVKGFTSRIATTIDDSLSSRPTTRLVGDVSGRVPFTDIWDTVTHYEIRVEVPGIPKDRMKIEALGDGTLTISLNTQTGPVTGEAGATATSTDTAEPAGLEGGAPTATSSTETSRGRVREARGTGPDWQGAPYGSHMILSERKTFQSTRKYRLGGPVDISSVKASLAFGVLKVSIKKNVPAPAAPASSTVAIE